MIKEYQVTLFCTTGQYKPVSTIVKKDSHLAIRQGREVFTKEIKSEGIKKICAQRYWNSTDLKRYGYNQVKIREYNKEKIEQEKKDRYEQIKKERGWAQ